jgi:DNA-binding MarR family transcriptional regulator
MTSERLDAWTKAGVNGENLGVFEFPTYAIGRLAGIIRRSFLPAYVEPFDLTVPEWRVLAAVAERSALSFNEICAAITMDRAQVSRTLSTLLAKGYVAQQTTVRAGRRGRGHNLTQRKLILTAEGRRLHRRVLPIGRRHQMILLATLNSSERAAVHAGLLKMVAAAERFEAARAANALPGRPPAKPNGEARRARQPKTARAKDPRRRASHAPAQDSPDL